MQNDIFIFQRIEKKYRISADQKNELLRKINYFLVPDEHGLSTIQNLYLDTPSFLLIRNSIDAKNYKEKLRIRSYGEIHTDSKSFLEIKKKFKGIVYKRRISLPLNTIYNYIKNGVKPIESQIMNEIDYSMKFYNNPKPKMFIGYEREAYYYKDDENIRLTFDNNLRFRDSDLHLENGSSGYMILKNNEYILEIKTSGAMPLWLSTALDELKIFPSSFSKYANAFNIINSKNQGDQL